VTYLLEREGSYRLPGIEVLWWDPRAERMRQALLPPIDLMVRENPGYSGEVFANSQEGGKRPSKEPGRTVFEDLELLLPWAPAVAGIFFFLLGARRFLSRKGISLSSWFVERERRRAGAEATYFRKFKKASRADDPRAALRHLMCWLDCTNRRPYAPTLDRFARHSSMPALIREAEALNGLLFARPVKREHFVLQRKWSGRTFYRIVARARAQISKTQKQQLRRESILSLNPRQGEGGV
jgi:hypothetical protein